MGSLKFQLVIYGGLADEPEPRVSADRVADVLRGMTQDVQEICRNLSPEEEESGAERVKRCRVYVEGPPEKGHSLAFPMAAEEDWNAIMTYATGVVELRESTDLGSPSLPRGFDEPILRRIKANCQGIGEDHNGFAVVLPAVNGTPSIRANFDLRLKTAIEVKLAVIANAAASEPRLVPDERTYGYSIQGILYELADPDYLNPDSVISVGVDTRDGRQWVCQLDRSIAPGNLQDLWKTEVLVTGTATFRPRKPILVATSFTPLPGLSDPVQAMDELIALCGDLGGEPVQAFMDRVRERD